jgi:hypothetical protein
MKRRSRDLERSQIGTMPETSPVLSGMNPALVELNCVAPRGYSEKKKKEGLIARCGWASFMLGRRGLIQAPKWGVIPHHS